MEHAEVGGGAEGEEENPKQNPPPDPRWAQNLTWGSTSQPWDHGPSWNQGLDTQPTKPSRRPNIFFINSFKLAA